MYTTYHYNSAVDINDDLLKSIKAAFKGKPIVITVEEEMDETAFLLSDVANKTMLHKSISQDKNGASVSLTITE